MRVATVSVNDRLELQICLCESGPPHTVRLSRITAQHISAALLEYAGATTKSYGRERDTTVGAVDVTERPVTVERRHSVVRLGSGTKRRVKV